MLEPFLEDYCLWTSVGTENVTRCVMLIIPFLKTIRQLHLKASMGAIKCFGGAFWRMWTDWRLCKTYRSILLMMPRSKTFKFLTSYVALSQINGRRVSVWKFHWYSCSCKRLWPTAFILLEETLGMNLYHNCECVQLSTTSLFIITDRE